MTKTVILGLLIRRFLITFYFNDSSIMIYEPETKNAGFKPGKFLEKNQYKNEERLIKRRKIIPTR